MPKCLWPKCQSNFIEITLWHWYSLVNVLHIFRTAFFKNTSGGLLLTSNTYLIYIIETNLFIAYLFFLYNSVYVANDGKTQLLQVTYFVQVLQTTATTQSYLAINVFEARTNET